MATITSYLMEEFGRSDTKQSKSSEHGESGYTPIALFQSPLRNKEASESIVEVLRDSEQPPKKQRSFGHSNPSLLRHHESTTPSELFYDLFFIANLSTFGIHHGIEDRNTLSGYIGFFCVLWFNWAQISLYDIRLAHDSIFDRVCKAVQFGVQLGFLIVSLKFDPASGSVNGQAFSLILMVSRIAQTLQYLSSLWFLRRHADAKKPLIAISAVTASAAVIYLGVSFAFEPYSNHYKAFVTWYVVGVLETLFNLFASSYWRVLSFKGTPIIDRMYTMTLIVFGEGIIVLAGSVQKVGEKDVYTSAFWGTIVCATMIIYFLYMLYFDPIPKEHFGSIKEPIWLALHFPLHLALVLSLLGASKFVVWQQAIEQLYPAGESLLAVPLIGSTLNAPADVDSSSLFQQTPAFFHDNARQIKQITDKILEQWASKSSSSHGKVDSFLKEIREGADSDDPDSLLVAIVNIVSLVATVIFEEGYGIQPPKGQYDEIGLKLLSFFTLYNLVYIYFWIGLGVTVILMGVLALFGRQHRPEMPLLRISAFFLVGLCLALLSTLYYSMRDFEGKGLNYLTSPWLLPTATLALALVMLVYHIPLPGRKKPMMAV